MARERLVRVRGGGCGFSKPEPAAEAAGIDTVSTDAPAYAREEDLVKLPSGGFACGASPLFKEYLGLLGEGMGGPSAVGPITASDALLVIDMQRDFVPKSATNATGGRFGVPEGEHIVPPIEQLIAHFVKCGGYVVATRDYHPVDHVSFMPKGPFPAHCVQGTPGSYFLPPIARALAAGKKAGGRVDVAFKGMHEGIDSFGAMPYLDGGEGRIQRDADLPPEKGLLPMQCMGCEAAPWTGSLLLKQSALVAAMTLDMPYDLDAPPDCFACLNDGTSRGLSSIQSALADSKRIFVCGLALDFCVLDTCLNAKADAETPREIFMVLDAARAAHIPGLGTFGSGFLSNPQEVLGKMAAASVLRTSTEAITGESPYGIVATKPAFPNKLGPLQLSLVDGLVLSLGDMSYKVQSGTSSRLLADVHRLSKQEPGGAGSLSEGLISPRAFVPDNWPGAPPSCTRLCWAYPLGGIEHSQLSFLAVSTSAVLQFVAYGGFLLLDEADTVLAVQAIAPESADHAVAFGPPRKWRDAFTTQLRNAGRFQPVTLPFMRDAGAIEFCWINPMESLTAGPEAWSPSTEGAFLYLMQTGDAIYFPAENPAPEKSVSPGKRMKGQVKGQVLANRTSQQPIKKEGTQRI